MSFRVSASGKGNEIAAEVAQWKVEVVTPPPPTPRPPAQIAAESLIAEIAALAAAKIVAAYAGKELEIHANGSASEDGLNGSLSLSYGVLLAPPAPAPPA